MAAGCLLGLSLWLLIAALACWLLFGAPVTAVVLAGASAVLAFAVLRAA